MNLMCDLRKINLWRNHHNLKENLKQLMNLNQLLARVLHTPIHHRHHLLRLHSRERVLRVTT